MDGAGASGPKDGACATWRTRPLLPSTVGLGGSMIKKLELVNDPRDYVAYDKLQIVPAGCAPPLK